MLNTFLFFRQIAKLLKKINYEKRGTAFDGEAQGPGPAIFVPSGDSSSKSSRYLRPTFDVLATFGGFCVELTKSAPVETKLKPERTPNRR